MPLARTTKWVTVLTIGSGENDIDRYHAAHEAIRKNQYAVFTFEPPLTDNWLVFEVPCAEDTALPLTCAKFVSRILLMMVSPYHRAACGLNVARINGHPTFNTDGGPTVDGLSIVLVNDDITEGFPQWEHWPVAGEASGAQDTISTVTNSNQAHSVIQEGPAEIEARPQQDEWEVLFDWGSDERNAHEENADEWKADEGPNDHTNHANIQW